MHISIADSSLYIFNQNLPQYRIFLKSTCEMCQIKKKKEVSYKDNDCNWSERVPLTLMDTEALLEMSIQR